jgi:hypothetical protein
MLKKNLLFILFLAQVIAFAQKSPVPNTEAEFEKEYSSRIKKDRLFGVYIPKDMTDAFTRLDAVIEPKDRDRFQHLTEHDAQHRLYFSLNRWLIQNWSFYSGSRYSAYLKDLGVHHPEDMAMFTLLMYHRNLNKKPLQIKEAVEEIKERRKKEVEDRMKNAKVISEQVIKKEPKKN